MCASIIPVFQGAVRVHPDFYVIIEYTSIPSMCKEFDPGPDEDDPFPEYYDTNIIVFLMDPHSHTVVEAGYQTMKQLYKYVEGRRDRIEFWRIMKYKQLMEGVE